MFKQLSRLASANQARVALNKVQTSVASQAFHLALKSSGTTLMRNGNGLFNQSLRLLNFQRQIMSRASFSTVSSKSNVTSVPDYQIDENEAHDVSRVVLTQLEVQQKHPIEYATKYMRDHLDYGKIVEANEFLLFNLPNSITKEKIVELCTHKNVHVLQSKLQMSLDEERPAFAWVKLGSPKEVKILKDKFRNVWLEDRKIKLKSKEDIGYEIYDHRTVIVRGLPLNFKKDELLQIFSNFGSLVSIELPIKNLAIEEELKNKVDQYQKARQETRITDVRRAQKVVSDSIHENADYYREVIQQHMGAEAGNNFMERLQNQFKEKSGSERVESLLNEKRHVSIQSMISQLQAESAQVSKAKNTLIKLRGYAAEESSPALEQYVTSKDLSQQILSNKDLLKNTISYLRQNREAIDVDSLAKLNKSLTLNVTGDSVDPIERLLSLQRRELSGAYDILLSCLEQREGIIQSRISQQVDHLGKEERVIFEQKDWSKELEDIKSFRDPFDGEYKAEEILSVSEQISNVEKFKNMDPQTRLYQILTKTFNPFIDANFNENQMANATSAQMQQEKIPREAADPSLPPSVNRDNFAGYVFLEDSLETLKDKVSQLRENFDLPFDELYHKEKRLVDQVIKATEALRQKESSLPDPMGAERIFSPDELKNQYISIDFSTEHQFIKDQRRRNDKLLSESIDTDHGSTNFSYKLDDTRSKIEELLAGGQISKKEYDMLKVMERESQEVNMGYAFVTFSHTDEAKIALIMAQGLVVGSGLELDLTVKNKEIDHGNFDQRYIMNQKRNQAQMVRELQGMRESREQLREFEQNMDKDLPSLKKIKEFKALAREVIDDPAKPKLGSLVDKRTSQEERDLDDKIRKMQRENPDLDLTQMFETERAEVARKAQHKKAFASYKAFQFLKHGVELQAKNATSASATPSQGYRVQPVPFQSADPYDFPPLQQAVDNLMKTKDKVPRVLDAGEPLIDRPGRKFGYSEKDFIEAYFGKDNARSARSSIDEEATVFGFNDSYKKKYPIDKYQKLPEIEAERRFLAQRADLYGDPNDAKDPSFHNLVTNLDPEREVMVQDYPHPTEQGRTLNKDTKQRVENYLRNKERKTGIEGIFNTREVGGITKSIREEYFPKPKKEEKPAADAVQEEKFEPFYEGEGKPSTIEDVVDSTQETSVDQISAITDDTIPKPRRQGRGQRAVQEAPQDNDWMNSLTYGGLSAPQEFEAIPLPGEARNANREFVYDYRFRKQHSTQVPQETQHTLRLKRVAQANNANEEEFFEQIKDSVNIENKNATNLDGRYSLKEKLGTGKTEKDVGQGRKKKVSSIQEFAGASVGSKDEDLSEREEEDIYNHYMNEMRRAKLEEAHEKISDKNFSKHDALAQEKIKDLENLFPEMPRFEGFLKSQSQGKHPFEEPEFTYSNEKASAEELKAESEYDEKLYERELEGRLINDTLTARQFESLYEARLSDNGSKIRFMKDANKEDFIDQRDLVRIIDEQRESVRRRNVMLGKWTEAESEQKMKELDLAGAKAAPLYDNDVSVRKDFMEFYEFFKNIQNPETVYDKEYYFDEGLGESLKEHVEDLKTRFPEVNVLVRRDRDGYPIVKTQYKPKYKYNIDEISNFNADESVTSVKESLDDILKTVMGKDNINQLDKSQLESKLALMMSNKQQEKNYDFDEHTKAQVAQLWKERVQGKFKNDREGFTKAFLKLQETAKFDESRELPQSFMNISNNGGVSMEETYNNLQEERKLITAELTEQLSQRIKQHMFLKQRKVTDFARAGRSETAIFERQVTSHENAARTLEEKAAQVVQANKEQEEGFDREAYQALKAEIKKRREAKERLLQQGFPELKPYVTI